MRKAILLSVALLLSITLAGCLRLEKISRAQGPGSPVGAARIIVDCPKCETVGPLSIAGRAPLAATFTADLRDIGEDQLARIEWALGDGAKDFGVRSVAHTYVESRTEPYDLSMTIYLRSGVMLVAHLQVNVTPADTNPYLNRLSEDKPSPNGWCSAQMLVMGRLEEGERITIKVSVTPRIPLNDLYIELHSFNPQFRIIEENEVPLTNGHGGVVLTIGVPLVLSWHADIKRNFQPPVQLELTAKCYKAGTGGMDVAKVKMTIE